MFMAALMVVAAAHISDFGGIFAGLTLGGGLALWALLRLAAVAGGTGRWASVRRLESSIRQILKNN